MKDAPADSLEAFLHRQDADRLVALLLELARDHDAVQARLERLQLADRPERLAARFKKTLSSWQGSDKFYRYREAGEFGRTLESWLGQVANELLPRDPPAALALFEAFIEADAAWFERADDSDGVIGDAVRAACSHWLTAASRCEAPPEVWSDRLLELYEADQYGARSALLQEARLLLDEAALRALVARLESRLPQAAEASPGSAHPATDLYRTAAALGLLAEALHDPDIRVRATLSHSPHPNLVQRQAFARDYLEAGRPADALTWLQGSWEHLERSREDLLAEALERLGRFEESLPIRKGMFEDSLSEFDLQRWLAHLPESSRDVAVAHARRLALSHDDVTASAKLLLKLDDAAAAEARLLAAPERIDGNAYGNLVPFAGALRTHGCTRGETAVYRALLRAILDRATVRAYGHAARYWARLGEIARSGVDLAPLPSHGVFETEIRSQHRRKVSFWAYVNGTRRDRHDDEDGCGE